MIRKTDFKGIPFLLWHEGEFFIRVSEHMEIVKEIEASKDEQIRKLRKIVEYDVAEIRENRKTIRVFLSQLGKVFEAMYDFRRAAAFAEEHKKKKTSVQRRRKWRG